MTTQVILPALGMSQETGKIVRWLKQEGAQVNKGEPIAEIETDKATVELEAPASGILSTITGKEGDDIPVGQPIALIQAANEVSATAKVAQTASIFLASPGAASTKTNGAGNVPASPLAARVAAEHNVDLASVTATGKRIQKADVLNFLQGQQGQATRATSAANGQQAPRLLMASPKARRLAKEQGKDLQSIQGTGPGGAILAADVFQAPKEVVHPSTDTSEESAVATAPTASSTTTELTLNTVWRIMAERTTQSWTSVPHFSLVREVNASRLIAWREQLIKRRPQEKITYTDLLVKIAALTLRDHPRVNASWNKGTITLHSRINVGLAAAVADGLLVPVIYDADTLSMAAIAQRRRDVTERAQSGRIRPEDLANCTFTISNLGMYGVDAFNAIINPPQAAILAVGRIADRVVPLHGQPGVQPMMVLTLSCDHRVLDGARAAQFLSAIADAIEEPLGLLG